MTTPFEPGYNPVVGYRVYAGLPIRGLDKPLDASVTINARELTTIGEILAAAKIAFQELSVRKWRYGRIGTDFVPEIYQTVAGGFDRASVDIS